MNSHKLYYLNFIILCLVFSLGLVSAVGSAPAVDPSMVAFYKFSNSSSFGESYNYTGSQIYDFSGNFNNLTTNNTLYLPTEGILLNGSFLFNGQNSSLFLRKALNFTGINSTFTISGWFNSSSIGAVQEIVGISNGTNSFGIMLQSSLLRIGFSNATTTVGTIGSTSTLSSNTLYSFIYVHNNSDRRLYLNGLPQYGSYTPTIIIPGDNLTLVGLRNNGQYGFNGTIGSIIFYNKSLTSLEVAGLYKTYYGCISPISGQSTFLYYPYDFCQGTFYANITSSSFVALFRAMVDNLTLDCNGSSIYGNESGSFFRTGDMKNTVLKNCKIYNFNTAVGVYDDAVNTTILNCSFYSALSSSIFVQRANSTFITNNYFFNSTSVADLAGRFIYLYDLKSNVTIKNNIFNVSSKPILVRGLKGGNYSYFLDIDNNYFYRLTGNGDGYSSNIHFLWAKNIGLSYVHNNYFVHNGCASILSQGVDNLYIYNNTFNFSYAQNVLDNVDCAFEVPTAIDLASNWKGWLSDSFNSTPDVSLLLTYSPTNITIIDNTFNDVPIFLRTSSPLNLSFNFNNYWKRSFIVPDYFMPRQDYYINNIYNNLTTTSFLSFSSLFSYVYTGISALTNMIGVCYYATHVPKVIMSINNQYLWYGNYNNSYAYNLSIYNQTNALIYFNNGSGHFCTGNCNLTLTPLNYSYILDNFNLTEGVSRQYSPIWFSSSSSTEKHIASNLTDSVNVSVITNIDCDRIYSIKYTPKDGITTIYNGNQAQSICGQLTTSGYELQINPSSESNVLEFTYGCSSSGFERIGYQLILLAGSLLIVGTILFIMYNRGVLQEMTVGQLILLFIAISVGIALFMASADNIAGVCRV